MTKKRSDDHEIVESLALVKEFKKQCPPDNQLVTDHLDGWEKTLHEALFRSVFQKSKRSKREST